MLESLPMLILASNSPRRRQLLSLEGWPYQVIPARVDENPQPGEIPQELVLRLAREKALDVGKIAPDRSTVIAADTTVVAGGQILGKPTDSAHAASILRELQGGSHQVITGLAVWEMARNVMLADYCVTSVIMRQYTDAEIQAYIATGDPLDKAGAYAIQHDMFNPVERIEGCYANVVGLPLCLLTALLASCGMPPARHITASCQPERGGPCRVAGLIAPDSP
jgi:MAF protein